MMNQDNFKPSWWNKFGKNEICGITQTRLRPGKYKNNKNRVIFLECKHGFYVRPLLIWIKNDMHIFPTCPNCRRVIDTSILKLIS